MAIASKIDIDVDSAAFRAFQEKFDKYKEALDKTPAAWRGIGNEVAKSKTTFEAVAEGIGVAAGSMALISKHSTDFYHVTTATARRPDPPTQAPAGRYWTTAPKSRRFPISAEPSRRRGGKLQTQPRRSGVTGLVGAFAAGRLKGRRRPFASSRTQYSAISWQPVDNVGQPLVDECLGFAAQAVAAQPFRRGQAKFPQRGAPEGQDLADKAPDGKALAPPGALEIVVVDDLRTTLTLQDNRRQKS